jgi:hypothetical protein
LADSSGSADFDGSGVGASDFRVGVVDEPVMEVAEVGAVTGERDLQVMLDVREPVCSIASPPIDAVCSQPQHLRGHVDERY